MTPPLEFQNYAEYLSSIPSEGRHILAQQNEERILVYQAYNHRIADYALEHQALGGEAYSFSRMSWIKPNFLWMMYRCGWTEKVNQERVLAMWIRKSDFEYILSKSVFSAYQEDLYSSREDWKAQVAKEPVRLQWDPDHDIYGKKEKRKAIQLGIKGKLLQAFAQEMIQEIIDLSQFVQAQKTKVRLKNLDQVLIPKEWVFRPNEETICQRIGLDAL